MKTLKYIAVICLAGLFLGACVKEEGPSEQNKGKAKPVVTLTKTAATDGVFTFTISADASAAHYGYVILAGKDNEAPAAYDIVVDEVGGTVDADVFAYADAASKEITLECDSNTDYQVFAAAITADGLVGDVVSLDAFVTDTVNPDIAVDEEYEEYIFEADGSVIYLQYTEPVSYVKDKEITATLYPGYSYDDELSIQGQTIPVVVVPGLSNEPVGTAKATVTVDNDVVKLDFGTLTPGTFFVISIPEGAFEDGAGNVTPAFASSFLAPYLYEYNGALVDALGVVRNNVFSYTENAPFALTQPQMTTIEDVNEWIAASSANPIVAFDSTATKFTTVIKHVEEVDGVKSETTSTYPMTIETHYAANDTAVLVRPAGAPKSKDQITITIPAGVVTDIYGNPNAQAVLGPFTYAYTPVYPKVGTYYVTSARFQEEFSITLEMLTDDPEGPYTLSADWFGATGLDFAYPVLYFTLDEPSRTLNCSQHIYNGQVSTLWGAGFYYFDAAHTQYISFWGGGDSGTDPIVMTYNDAGELTTISYFEYGVSQDSDDAYLGRYEYCDDDTPIRTAPSGSSVSAQSASKISGSTSEILSKRSVRK